MTNPIAEFVRLAGADPERLAFSHADGDFTYGWLAQRAGVWARWMADSATAGNGRIGILSGRTPENYAAILGAMWGGCMYVPLNPKLPLERLQRMIDQARLDAVAVDGIGEALARQLALPARVLRLGEPASAQVAAPLAQPRPFSPDQFVYLMFTSGTTGEPKGIAATWDNLRHYLDFMQARYRIGPQDRLSQLFEMSFDASVFDFLMALNHGASFHVVPDGQVMAPAAFIRRQRLTVWFGVPSTIAFLQKMRMLKPLAFPDLRVSIFGGEPLPLASVRAWQSAAPSSVIDNVYGPTEATVTCFVQRCSDPVPVTANRDVVGVGRPYTGTSGAVVDEHGEVVPDGEAGELIIHGPQVTPGYWRNPDQTAQRFRRWRHPQLGEGVWYFTGDMAYRDSAGVFHHLGRMDNQIKLTGHRVELEEVDASLREASGSEAAAAVAWPVNHGSAQGLVGFISGSRMDVESIKQRLKERLPTYMVPKRLVVVDALPYTLNGKVDRKALQQRLDAERGMSVQGNKNGG